MQPLRELRGGEKRGLGLRAGILKGWGGHPAGRFGPLGLETRVFLSAFGGASAKKIEDRGGWRVLSK
jgi:hypothetical protein